MIQGGQISNFKFVVEDGIKYFVKSWDKKRYNSHSLLFQELMIDLDIPLKINKVISKDDDKLEAKFEYIDEKKWNFDIEKASMLGESMAKIHNWSATSKKVHALNIPEKKCLYDNMNDWIKLDIGKIEDSLHEIKLAHRMYRDAWYEKLKSEGIKPGINPDQPKVATHRDFKKHNIISDGENLHLIDFDFTAVEYVSLEIMSFLADCVVPRNMPIDREYGADKNERAQICIEFLLSYKKHSKLDIKWESVLYDYLFYLISSTFPYYIKGLKQEDIIAMGKWRTIMAEHLFNNRKNLTKALTL